MKHLPFISILLLIIFISFVPYFLTADKESAKTAEIYSDSKLIYSINFFDIHQPYEMSFENNGHANTVLIEESGISVTSASCPDKLCVKQGKISDSLIPVVCLPNNFMILIKNSKNTSIDAISR